MECRCDKDNFENAATGWWPNGNSIQMGAYTVVGYLLYRFSQTLPALIRWPIRLFCSLTGLSALWGWVSRLVRTFRGIQSLFKWLSQIWRFIIRASSNEALELETDPTSSSPYKPGLRLILLGPSGGGQTSLADILLGNSETKTPVGPLMESTKRRTVLDGREVTVINTPDLLGSSLEKKKKAREALRSLQLASPGPHAFLLVINTTGSRIWIEQDATQAIRAILELFGNGVMEYIIPVLSHADEGLRRAVSLCGQRPELVDIKTDWPPEVQSVKRRQIVERVMEMKGLRGRFVHELQRREEHTREELLADMSFALARKLEHVN